MYLAELKIWNFRRFGETPLQEGSLPGLHLCFNKNLNLLVGENDSGKTAIIDAIKLVLQTRSYDSIRFGVDDLHLPITSTNEKDRADKLKIECVFRGFETDEAKNFLEWLAIDETGYWLRVFLVANRKGRSVPFETRAGLGEGTYFNEGARDLLRTTYLKPLRDAESELAPRRGSRISQILDSHEVFQEKEDHQLIKIVEKANDEIELFFSDGKDGDRSGKQLNDDLDAYLGGFSDTNTPLASRFSIAETRLRGILERLKLSVLESTRITNKVDVYPGLGSHNLLFVAAELLLLKVTDYEGLRLALIEEIEAHLHPQAQLRLIEFLQDHSQTSNIQLILTTHSPILASKIKLENLIICKDSRVYSLAYNQTKLEKSDYGFLERFLDSTKANLFFARGVILVEGDAENLIIPTIAQILDIPLAKYGVSVVNVGSTAFLRYARIFQRQSEPEMDIRVAVITDIDVKPDSYKSVQPESKTRSDVDVTQQIENKCLRYNGQCVKTFVSPHWTLEYCIAMSTELRELLLTAIHCAAEEKRNNTVTEQIVIDLRETSRKEIATYTTDSLTDEDIALKIYYGTLLKKSLSKAITAQWFSKLLLDNIDTLRSILKTDANIGYLVEAIKYAAGIPVTKL